MIHKTYTRFLSVFFVAFFASLLISGCSSSTTPPPTTTTPPVSPKTGSSYTYSTYSTDSTGTMVPGSGKNTNASVTADSMHFLGQNNVYTVIDNGDTIYFTYASNNDVMIYYQSNGFSGLYQSIGDSVYHRWIRLGTTSKTNFPVLNDSFAIAIQGNSIPAYENVVSNYIADTNIVVGTETLTAHHCRIMATATSNAPFVINPPVVYTNQRDIYFVDKIGYVAQVTTRESLPAVKLLGSAGNVHGSFKVLTSYTLK